MAVSKAWVQWGLQDAKRVATTRQRLQSLSWFMRCLKEPLSRLANRQDQTSGAFFEGRFKSVAILDEESPLAVCPGSCMKHRSLAPGTLQRSPATSCGFISQSLRVES